MGRPKKSVPAPAELEPEEISQEEPEEDPETDEEPEDDEPEAASGKAISKASAVRDALEQGEEGPEDGVAYIKKVHGIEMTRQMFSSYKAQEKARQAKKGGAKAEPAAEAKPGRKTREVAETSHVAAPKPAASDHEMIDDLTAVKHLVQKLGAEQVRKIVGLFE